MQDEPPYRDDLAVRRDEFLLAACFLTRLPIRPKADAEVRIGALAAASWAFPLIGILVGIIGGVAFAAAAALGVPPLPAALLAVAATVLATGALHEDGLADTLDGFGGGRDRDAKLAIMRDSRNGAYGVLALVFSVSLRAASLAAVAEAGIGAVLAALVAAHVVGRAALPMALRQLDPARPDGLGATAGRPDVLLASAALAVAVVLALLLMGVRPGLAALLCAGAAMAGVAMLARWQIGGYTGDVLGAIEQGGEIVVMLVAASWAQ
jgi:adenosylcobinamide-GDP ribazoletransferase